MVRGNTGIVRQNVLDDQGNQTEQILETNIAPKDIAGGFNMTYKDPLYDFIETLTPAQFKLYRLLEKMILSRSGNDVKIIGTEIARNDTINIKNQENTRFENIVTMPTTTNDPAAVSKMLTHMVKHDIVMETKAKHYRFNPFVVIPAFADGEFLQREWQKLRGNKEFKRRGRDILDEYYAYKIKHKEYKLTFKEWQKYNEDNDIDIFVEPSIMKP